MLSQGQVGPITSTSDSVQVALRAGRLGDQIVSQLHGRYKEAAFRGTRFVAANQAAQAVSVALATAATGLIIYNPISSGKLVAVDKVGIGLSVAPAAIAAIGVQVGYHASTALATTTAAGIRNALIGTGSAPVTQAYTIATLPVASTVSHVLLSGFTAAALSSSSPVLCDLEGSIVLPPGAWAAIYALTAVTGLFSFSGEELPYLV